MAVAIYIAPAASDANDPSGLFPDSISPADVAWTLCATVLQLLLTPGKSEGGREMEVLLTPGESDEGGRKVEVGGWETG